MRFITIGSFLIVSACMLAAAEPPAADTGNTNFSFPGFFTASESVAPKPQPNF